MLGDGPITGAQPHVPDLTFAEILKHAVSSAPIRVSVLKALLASDDDNQWVVRRCDDPALLLSTKARVDVSPSIISTANLEPPTYRFPHSDLYTTILAALARPDF